MASIQEAMSNSAKLLDAAANGALEPAVLTAEVTKLLASSLGARGFMAALATSDLPQDKTIRAALIEGIRAGKESSYELIIKNIIMASCSAQEHEKNGRLDQAKLSRATSTCSLELAGLLQDSSLAELSRQALLAIDHWPPGEATQTAMDPEDPALITWQAFFERWGYSRQYLDAVTADLRSIAEAA